MKQLNQNLLGLPAIEALGMIRRVHAIGETQESIQDSFPSLFKGLGTLKAGQYEIKIKPGAKPFALYTARHVPFPLREKVQKELARMEELGVISKIEQPSEWCAAMVVVPKKSGAIRICIDYRPLNEVVFREVHPLPKVDESLAQLSGAVVFSKLDANSGFWQIPLSEGSRYLTTFITPFGRYFFNKLPFGICSAPEYFQRKMSQILDGIEGVQCHMDDMLVYGRNKEEHDDRLIKVLHRIQDAGITLNKDKCEFHKDQLIFLGHVIDKRGISPDPCKTKAIIEMASPKTMEVRRFLGMVNQMGKSPNIASLSKPLRDLLGKKQVWNWSPFQEMAFQRIKMELTNTTVLAPYDVHAETKITADASAYGLGAVITQKQPDMEWKPVAYASRSMSETENQYSQIEKEALALVWVCERFSDYILGKSIVLETDHKPLVPLLTRTTLSNLPPRVLRFRLRLARFQYEARHVPGKLLYTADTLSRVPLKEDSAATGGEESWVVHSLDELLPASQTTLDNYRRAQREDQTCRKLIDFSRNGWPAKHQIKSDLKKYWQNKGQLTVVDNLLLYGERIVVPQELQMDTLDKIHNGHQGFQKCHQRIGNSVWWPGVSKDLEAFVKRCPVYLKTMIVPTEPSKVSMGKGSIRLIRVQRNYLPTSS